MATSTLTENDILKTLVRRGAVSELCKELNAQILSSPRADKGANQDSTNDLKD